MHYHGWAEDPAFRYREGDDWRLSMGALADTTRQAPVEHPDVVKDVVLELMEDEDVTVAQRLDVANALLSSLRLSGAGA